MDIFSNLSGTCTLIFISGCGSAISSAKEGKSGFVVFPGHTHYFHL